MQILKGLTAGLSWAGMLMVMQPMAVLAQMPMLPSDSSAVEAAPAAPVEEMRQSSPNVGQNYTLGAGDRVKFDLFDVPDYSGEFQVLSDGTLSLPRIGTVLVRGLTLDQATAEIEARYARYVRRPSATLSLLQAGALNVAIAGQVNRPGTYVLSPEEIAGAPTVTQVIQLAGGITQSADIRSIQVRRFVPQAGGGSRAVQVDLWELLQSGDIDQDLVLQDRDTIFIPTATALNASETTELASASFSPDTMTVNVVGEVAQPGAIAVPPNTPLNQALLAAGGFNTRARRSEVTLIRLNPNGSVSQQEIEVDLAQGVDLESNPALRNNDTIVVGRSGLTSVTDTLGTILSPLTSLFRLLGL